MSRIGKMPIAIPKGVQVDVKESEVTVKGPKGTLSRSFNRDMAIKLNENVLTVTRPSDNRLDRALHGLTRSLLANMVNGVTQGFSKELEITGVGYRGEKSGDKLVLRLGFSHTVDVVPKEGIKLDIESGTRIKVSGIDKEAVGEMAAKIRAIRPYDSYKGKGLKYAGEAVRLKPGKAGKAVGGKK